MFASRLHPLINNLCLVLPKMEIKSDFKCVFLQFYFKKKSIKV